MAFGKRRSVAINNIKACPLSVIKINKRKTIK